MSRRNRRSRDATPNRNRPAPPDATAPQPEAPPNDAPPSRSRFGGLFRRDVERLENEPGYATPGPWSVRGMLTLALMVILIQVAVGSIAWATAGRGDRTVTWASVLISVDPVRAMLYALVAMPFARRLAQERRSMRALETLSAGAVIYILYFLSVSIAVSLSKHAYDPNDGRQMAGAGAAALLGTATGAALFPVVYRRFWMPRLGKGR
jgi:hypothetical protein